MNPDPLALDPVAHAPVVRRALRSLGVPPESLDDAVQDVFTVVVRREQDFDRDRSLTNWLWGIARGVASTHRRSRQRRARLALALASSPLESSSLDDALARTEATRWIAEFVQRLPTQLREVFVLAHLHGHSGPEIAEKLGINLNTAYARVRTTRLRLEAELAPPEPTTIGARIMRAFAPMFAATSKSFATASLTASLVYVGVTMPTPMRMSTTAPNEVAPAVAQAIAIDSSRADHARTRPARTAPQSAKEPVMINTTIAKAALGAALLTTPSLALAAPAKAKPARAPASDTDADESARRTGDGNVSYYDFVEGDRAEGIVLVPEGANLESRIRQKFPSLITLRGHFLPELVRLAKDL